MRTMQIKFVMSVLSLLLTLKKEFIQLTNGDHDVKAHKVMTLMYVLQLLRSRT
jgi:hypothetical protein